MSLSDLDCKNREQDRAGGKEMQQEGDDATGEQHATTRTPQFLPQTHTQTISCKDQSW